LSFSFNSVDDFLRKASEAKSEQRAEANAWAQDFLNDPHTIGVPVEMADTIGALLEKHGDEPLRQIALFCLGKWYGIHTGVIQEMIVMEDTAASIAGAMDAARISGAIQLLESVGSFGGDDSWREMLKESIVSEVDEHKAREQNDG
jgi:hypothetical protein